MNALRFGRRNLSGRPGAQYARRMHELQLTAVEADTVVWRLPDPGGEWTAVRLWSDYDLGDTSFAPLPDGWELALPISKLPPVDRLEYLFEVTRDGHTHSILDPGNALRVGGAFGEHSWVSVGYRPPGWLDLEPAAGERQTLVVTGTPVGTLEAEIWSPTGTDPDAALPLLLSHDGPEMDALGELTRFVGAMITRRHDRTTEDSAPGSVGLPAIRVALLAPGPRDERYAANPAYAQALVDYLLPALGQFAPTATRPVLMGQSLGALAALHAEWTHPGTFAGLLLQSGSFFCPDLDAQESGFAQWRPIVDFVADVMAAHSAPSRPPVGICFGTAEENAGNNAKMAAKLTALGLDVGTGEVRDGHTFTCWRDLLDPHLSDLLRRAWRI